MKENCTYSVVRSLCPVIAGLTRNPLWFCGGLWLGGRNDFVRLNKYRKLIEQWESAGLVIHITINRLNI